MGTYSIYFSPTGGTKKVMDILAEEWKVADSIDLSLPECNYGKYQFQKEDICLIGVPSFGGRVPAVALERLKAMGGNGASAVLVVAYGNRDYDDTFLELKNELAASGFVAKAAIAAVTEHSIMHQFGTGRPDKNDVEELKAFARKVKDTWRERTGDLNVPGNEPYKAYNGVPFKPKAGSGCGKCGKCVSLCPVGAIPKENPTSVDAEKCISCMRCVEICPKHARSGGKFKLFIASCKLKKALEGRKENKMW